MGLANANEPSKDPRTGTCLQRTRRTEDAAPGPGDTALTRSSTGPNDASAALDKDRLREPSRRSLHVFSTPCPAPGEGRLTCTCREGGGGRGSGPERLSRKEAGDGPTGLTPGEAKPSLPACASRKFERELADAHWLPALQRPSPAQRFPRLHSLVSCRPRPRLLGDAACVRDAALGTLEFAQPQSGR